MVLFSHHNSPIELGLNLFFFKISNIISSAIYYYGFYTPAKDRQKEHFFVVLSLFFSPLFQLWPVDCVYVFSDAIHCVYSFPFLS